jgi:hypothetical protein
MGLTDYTISDKKFWQAGRDYERQRIIKLLEPLARHNEYLCADICSPEDCNAFSFEHAIALIKGEQK